MNMENATPASDLEIFELMCAAYPEKFDENAEGCIWDEVMEFAEDKFGDEFGGIDVFMEFIGRIVYLTQPVQSAISGGVSHCLGKVEIKDGSALMTSAISRRLARNNR